MSRFIHFFERYMLEIVAVLGMLILGGISLSEMTFSQVEAKGHPRVIKARAFQVIDDTGKIRASLQMVDDRPMIRLFGKFNEQDKRTYITVSLDEDYGLRIWDKDEVVCIVRAPVKKKKD